MTIRRDGEGIVLEGICPVEDSEPLLQHLQDGAAFVDWSGCTHLHTACLQVLLAARPTLRGMPASDALAACIAPLLPNPTLSPVEA